MIFQHQQLLFLFHFCRIIIIFQELSFEMLGNTQILGAVIFMTNMQKNAVLFDFFHAFLMLFLMFLFLSIFYPFPQSYFCLMKSLIIIPPSSPVLSLWHILSEHCILVSRLTVHYMIGSLLCVLAFFFFFQLPQGRDHGFSFFLFLLLLLWHFGEMERTRFIIKRHKSFIKLHYLLSI